MKTAFLITCVALSGLWRPSTAQIQNVSNTGGYQSALRSLLPKKWYVSATAMLRVTLKKGTGFKALSLDSLTLEGQLDSIKKQGYDAIEIFATPYGGKSFNGLDAIDRYRIDPSSGTMDDFKRLIRQAHRQALSVIAFDNLGYSSVDAPAFLKACHDIHSGVHSKETKWFNWADSSTAAPPMTPDSYFLGGTKKWEKWVYSPLAGKYYWSKWDGRDKDGKPCSLPQYRWSTEWQQEVKEIVQFWMNTGIDGMVVDAVNWYTNYTWQIGKDCITNIVSSYGNTFIQPEGAGGFHEDPVPWIEEGGWNCVQDYGLGIWWEKQNNILINSINNHNPSGLERALRDYHDRVVTEGGVLYMGADATFKNPTKYYLYVAFSIATGHLYCRSLHANETFNIDDTLQNILTLKKNHAAFGQRSTRQSLSTNDNTQFYAFVQTAADQSEQILCIFNFQPAPQQITVNLSGVYASALSPLNNAPNVKLAKKIKVSVPAYGYRFFKIIP